MKDGDRQIEQAAQASHRQRQEALTAGCARLMAIVALFAWAVSLFEERNDIVISIIFYAPMVVFLGVVELLTRVGRHRLAAWTLSSLFWGVVALATWFFGGLENEMGSAYVISVVLAAATLGAKEAVGFGLLSAASASVVAYAQAQGMLPEGLAPSQSPLNAWIAVATSLLLAAFLLGTTLRTTQEAWLEAARAAREKDHAETKYLLAQKVEPIGRLASGVAHDFNNILNVITNVSSLLREAEPSERDELLNELDSAATRAELMTRQLLALNRKRTFEPQALDLAQVLTTLVPVIGRLLGDEIQVRLRAESGVCWVMADQGQMEQVLMNLVVNAREAMPTGGELTILCERTGREGDESVRLTVTDTGVGISQELADDVFQPFFSTKRNGTGLGLATVRDVLERHRGSVSLRSAEGRGTTFEVRIPAIAPAEKESPVVVTDVSEPASGARVLLVEDEPRVRRANARILEVLGYDVLAVSHGAEALSLLSGSTQVDVILSDISMPVMTGVELARHLAGREGSPPIVLVTGHVSELPEEIEQNELVVGFLTKPFSKEILDQTLRQAIVAPRSSRRAEAQTSLG